MGEKITLYTEDTLSDRINGEAEIFFSYGFKGLVSGRYQSMQDPRIAVDADVYELGSPLDAFGMFANYRHEGDGDAGLGTESALEPSQLFFYQDRYLVRIQATGALSLDKDVFLRCGKAISQNLPSAAMRPKILDVLQVSGVVSKSERYIAQSMLGYDFFPRGIAADALVNGEPFQIFVVIADSENSARKSFDDYQTYLRKSRADLRSVRGEQTLLLRAADPLYGTVLLAQSGRYLVGASKVKNVDSSTALMQEVQKRLAANASK